MCDRFLKFIPSQEAFWLLHNKPNAFRLLTHIANTARRNNGHPDGLTVGQCHLMKWEKYGFTEQEYRTAKNILISRKHIIIIETNRTRKKSTTGSTTSSTLVELISSTVYDINSESVNDRINVRPTTDQRLTNDKQEGIRKNKNIKEDQSSQTLLSKIHPIDQILENDELTDDILSEKRYNGSDNSMIINNIENQKQHNINYQDVDFVEVYPGNPLTGVSQVLMKRSMYLKCLSLKCINNSEEALRSRVKEIQEDPKRREELKNWDTLVKPAQEGGWKIYNQKSSREKTEQENLEFAKRIQKELPEDKWIKGYRSRDYYEKEKDQKGFLIECITGNNRLFVAYTDRDFEEKIRKFLNEKGFPVALKQKREL